MEINSDERAQPGNALDRLLRSIPGFRGYFDKETRRDSDRLQRDWLADRLDQAKRAIDPVARSLTDAGQIDSLPQLDRLRGRLDRLIARIRGAMRGYSGFFDLVQVDEECLDEVYEHDADMTFAVVELAKTIERLSDQPDKIAPTIEQIEQHIEQLNQNWNHREDILKGIGSGQDL